MWIACIAQLLKYINLSTVDRLPKDEEQQKTICHTLCLIEAYERAIVLFLSMYFYINIGLGIFLKINGNTKRFSSVWIPREWKGFFSLRDYKKERAMKKKIFTPGGISQNTSLQASGDSSKAFFLKDSDSQKWIKWEFKKVLQL